MSGIILAILIVDALIVDGIALLWCVVSLDNLHKRVKRLEGERTPETQGDR